MLPPFALDKLTPQDRTTLRRWYAVVGGVYAALAMSVVAVVVAQTDLVPTPGPGLLATGAVAAEHSAMSRCAARDAKVLARIELAGDTHAVPGQQVYEAFVAMLEARALCAAGRVDEAFALYDNAAAVPVQSAAQ